MTQLVKRTDQPSETNDTLYESLALRGDISGLNPKEKARYYGELCTRLGLDPYTQPFIPLKLNGKEVLYASRGATDQLARLHRVTRSVVSRERVDDVYVVTVRAELPSGRAEDSIGAVALGAQKGDALANALMKAETKAKRRATLALLGLGLLDESELETIPARAMVPLHDEMGATVDAESGELTDPPAPVHRLHAAPAQDDAPPADEAEAYAELGEQMAAATADTRETLEAEITALTKRLGFRPNALTRWIQKNYEAPGGFDGLFLYYTSDKTLGADAYVDELVKIRDQFSNEVDAFEAAQD